MNEHANQKSMLRDCETLFHLAGVLADATIPKVCRPGVERSFQPKVNGAVHMIMVLGAENVGQCFMFSSVSSFFGSPGQASYAAANACLDHLAEYHWQRAQALYSFQWGPWSEAGMAVAVDRETSRQSASQCFGGLKNAAGVQIMASFIHVDACVAVVPSQMARKLAKQHCKKEVKTTTKDVASAAPSPSKSALSRITVDAEIRDLLKSLLGENTIGMHAETPLNDVGMDSLSAVQFRRDLGNSVDLKLPSTFTFDHPTIRDIVEHIAPSQTRSPVDGPSTTETGLALSMPSDSTYCALAASSNRCGDMSSKELLPALM